MKEQTLHEPKNYSATEYELLAQEALPQNPDFYTKDIQKKKLSYENFLEHYFNIWNTEAVSIPPQEAMWAHNVYKHGDSYGENLQLIDADFFTAMLQNSNFSNYATVNQRAVTLDLLNIRAFPTTKPLFKNPSKAGEGFPFDYMQNSTVAPNKPILISHYSKDKEWVFIQTSFAFGWVKSKDIALIPNKYSEIWKKAQQILFIKDGVPLYSQAGEFLFHSRIGMALPLITEDSESFTVLVVKSYKNNEAYYESSKVSKEIANNGALPFESKYINIVLNELLKSNYGWGGLYGQRDCSSTLRDFYTPFGLWLPRNSFMQAQQGRQISLEKLSDQAKIETIKKNAIPFETLLYKQGHIVLYVGTLNDEVVVFQNLWGIKTKDGDTEGRSIVGKTLFSRIDFGKTLEHYDTNASLLSNLKSMNFPTEEN